MRRFVETCDAVAATTKKTEKVRLVSEIHKDALDRRRCSRREERALGIGGSNLAKLLEYTDCFLQHTTEDRGFRRMVEPKVVIEVAFNNIQRSKRHDSGYALRFPRIFRLRPDKQADKIDTRERVAQLYAKQVTLPRH